MTDALTPSWPGLTRPSTSLLRLEKQDVDARDDKRGHDDSINTIVRITSLRTDRP
jgi:hypothetical protein